TPAQVATTQRRLSNSPPASPLVAPGGEPGLARSTTLGTSTQAAPLALPPTAQSLAPPRPPSRLNRIFGIIVGLFSSAFGLFFAIFGVLSLPLGVIAVIHLTGWSWFLALVGILLFSCIPLIGQLGYLVLAGMGVYYFWSAHFDWHRAAYPATQT